MRFADHMYRHFFHDGPLTAAKNQARLDVRASQVESGIMAESARWGDAKTSPARNASHWRSARTSTRNWFNTRSTQFITEARSKGFYPVIDPPVMNQRGGSVAPGFQVVLTKADKREAIQNTSLQDNLIEELSVYTSAHPRIILTSSETGQGIDKLRAEIAQMYMEFAPRSPL